MSDITPWSKLRFHQRLARLGIGTMMVGAVVALLIDNFYGVLAVAVGLAVFVIAAAIES